MASKQTNCLSGAEPMLESWPFVFEYSHKAMQRNVSLQSNNRVNVIITPAAFRSLGDARSFVLLLRQVCTARPPRLLADGACAGDTHACAQEAQPFIRAAVISVFPAGWNLLHGFSLWKGLAAAENTCRLILEGGCCSDCPTMLRVLH